MVSSEPWHRDDLSSSSRADPVGEVSQIAWVILGEHRWVRFAERLSGVNYFFGLTTTISPDQRQLLFDA
jgi:hypothetical protein